MEAVKSLSGRHIEQKRWGWEEWIVNNDMYCGKRLHFTTFKGTTSLHFHAMKHETMYVELGSFQVTIVDTTLGSVIQHYLGTGHSLTIPPLTPHRIISLATPSVMVEFSTHHENSDSYRIEE